MTTLLITRKEVKSLLQMSPVITAVEQAFKDMAQGHFQMPPKSYLSLERGDFRAMPAALPDAAGIKWVCVYPQNPSHGLATVMATIIYSDPQTGYPLAIMDATDITNYRTGATAAIASKYMARDNSDSLGLIGAGQQARTQLLAHLELFKFSDIRVYDRSPAAVQGLIKDFSAYPLRACSLSEAAAADIVCTVTPAREPVIMKEMVRPGTHINAIGADAAGKEELDPDILNGAYVIVDDFEQAVHGGEINVPVRMGLFHPEQIHATLAQVVFGQKRGRPDDRAITIFDSTGVAIEDIAVARLIYEKAVKQGGFQSVNMTEI